MKALDLTGKTFGEITVLSRAENTKDGKERVDADRQCRPYSKTTDDDTRQ